jgi:hypothetical protein
MPSRVPALELTKAGVILLGPNLNGQLLYRLAVAAELVVAAGYNRQKSQVPQRPKLLKLSI